MKRTENTIRDQVVSDYMPLVVYEARRLHDRLPASVELDDLVSSGTLGLLDAIRRFDVSREVKFKTYAVHRIRGAMLDFLRSDDFYSRSVRDFERTCSRAAEAFTQKNKRPPSLGELAASLDKTADELARKLALMPASFCFESLDETENHPEPTGAFGFTSGENQLLLQQRSGALAEIINKTLSHNEQCVLQLYFWDELRLREIAEVLDLTESRISQILTNARRKIYSKIKYHELFSDVA